MINIDKAALGFNAVGSKHRLGVLLELVKVGKSGLTILVKYKNVLIFPHQHWHIILIF